MSELYNYRENPAAEEVAAMTVSAAHEVEMERKKKTEVTKDSKEKQEDES